MMSSSVYLYYVGLFDAPVIRGYVTDSQATEVSGLGASRRHRNILYALNDSGHSPK